MGHYVEVKLENGEVKEVELDDNQIEDIVKDNIESSHVKDFLSENSTAISGGYFNEELSWGDYIKVPEDLDRDLFDNISMVQLEKLTYFINHIDDIKYENLVGIVRINNPGQEIL